MSNGVWLLMTRGDCPRLAVENIEGLQSFAG